MAGIDQYTKLLIHSDTTDGSTTFTDSSGEGCAITVAGNAHHETDQKKFGATSIYFDGSGDDISIADSFDASTGSWTIDFWMNPFDSGVYNFVGKASISSPYSGWYIQINSNKLSFHSNNNDILLTSVASVPAGSWTHVAFVYDGSVLKLYINGLFDASVSTSIQNYSSNLTIGRMAPNYDPVNYKGYIDEFRLSVGVARWTANFTPPTAPYSISFDPTIASDSVAVVIDHTKIDANLTDFPVVISLDDLCPELITDLGNEKLKLAVTDTTLDGRTVLLIHSDNEDGDTSFKDVSQYEHNVIREDDGVHSTDHARFGNSSIKFAGGGGLSTPDSGDWDFRDGDFTIDLWVYNVSADSSWYPLVSKWGDTKSWWLGTYNGNVEFYYNSDSSHFRATTALPVDQWVHVAAVRSGSSFYFFLGGVLAGSFDIGATVINTTPVNLMVGHDGVPPAVTGYMDEIRVSKGIARWEEDFTPPTTPYPVLEQCPVEIECWEENNHVIHTKIPSISSTADTEFKILWDSAQADNTDFVGATNSTPAENVWDDDFVAVYHMAQDPSGGSGCILDSTSNGLNGTPSGMDPGDSISGSQGKGLVFDGSSYVNCGNDAKLNPAGDHTFEALIKTTLNPSTNPDLIVSVYQASSPYPGSGLDVQATTGYLRFNACATSVDITDSTEHYIVGAQTATAITVFIDGAQEASNTSPQANPTGETFYLGTDVWGNNFSGNIYETRISKVVRSDAWIKATNASLTKDLISVDSMGVSTRKALIVSDGGIKQAAATDVIASAITDTNNKFAATTVDAAIDEIGETAFWNGFDRVNPDTMGDLSWDNSTRTVSLAVHSGEDDFHYWANGQKVSCTTTKTYVVPEATSETYYVYMKADGTMDGVAQDSITLDIAFNLAITAIVNWNTTTNIGKCGEERHGIRMPAMTHYVKHLTTHAQYASGFEITGLTDGGSTFTGIESGVYFDEDVKITIAAQMTMGFMYRSGADADKEWTFTGADNEVGEGGSGSFVWNELDAGTWGNTAITGNDCAIMFVMATNELGGVAYKLIGQNLYGNVRAARAAVEGEIRTLKTDGLPNPEFLFLHAYIINKDGLKLLADGETHLDFREVVGGTPSAASSATVAANVSIADSGDIITADNVEDALQENRTAINLNTDKTAAINKIISGVDVKTICCHKVAWDDDPDWIDKCGDTAWYNEPLNTATRGKTREFPAEVLIVGESDKVTFYDLTDPDVPMWMVFIALSGLTSGHMLPSSEVTSIKFIHGNLYVSQLSMSGRHGVLCINFIEDKGEHYYDSKAYSNFKGNIAQRNEGKGWAGSSLEPLVGANVYDLAVTLLPNAPVNPATGQRYPTIAVATDGGVSIIDGPAGIGTVVDMTCSNTSYQKTGWVNFRNDGALQYTFDAEASYARYIRVTHTLPSIDTVITSAAGQQQNSDELYTFVATSIPAIKALYNGAGYKSDYIGTKLALNYLKANPSNPSSGAVAYITKDYNTGLMRGDIKTCLMADTESGTVSDTELVTNGIFDSDSDWTKDADWTISGGTANKVTGTDYAFISQSAPLVFEKYYRVKFTVSNYSGSGEFGISGASGTRIGTYSRISNGDVDCFLISSGNGIRLYGHKDVAGSIDNVSITEAIPDRSVAGNHAQVIGSLTKSPVASGAELMAFGEFSAGDYSKIPYSSDFDFGTGDFYISCWGKMAINEVGGRFMSASTSASSSSTWILYAHSASTGLAFYGPSSGNVDTDIPINDGSFHKLEAVRSSGILFLYIDGEVRKTQAFTDDLTTTFDIYLGLRPSDGGYLLEGAISLSKLSKTAPTPEQIKADYLAELPMFQENAKCTLSGSSNNVLAHDYDASTDEATVLTDVKDVFSGLINVEQGSFNGTARCVDSGDGVVAIGTSTQASVEKPEINLREELAKQPQRSFIPQQFWFTGDGSETDFDLPAGYDVWAVYSVGLLQKEGSSDEYEIEDNGSNKTVTFNTAPASGADICIMGVAS